MKSIAIAATLVLLGVLPVQAQDRDWVRTWEEAQRQRPRTIGSAGRIAAANEPGTPLVVHGRVFQADGKTPAAGIMVFAYQTDNKGEYNRNDAAGWRLRGWAQSDAQGRFEFHTIRPASYPSGRTPAHIHVTIEGPRLPRRWTTEVHFLDDPFLSDGQKRQSAALGAFGSVRPVTTRQRTQHVDYSIRIAESGKF